jgi:hypothetical protein
MPATLSLSIKMFNRIEALNGMAGSLIVGC